MKGKLLPARVGFVVALLMSAGCLYRHRSATCKQRGDAFNARVETLKREAHEKLKVGTKKDSVIRFFTEKSIPITFNRGEASGTIYTTGCGPSGFGSDA